MKRWRVGSLSMGITLLSFGILLLVSFFATFNALNIVLILWPVVLICLGIEIFIHLFFRREDEVKLRYDVIGILFTACILIISVAVYAISVFMNSFESKTDFYAYFDSYPYTVGKEYEHILGDCDTLKINSGIETIKVVPTSGEVFIVKYYVSADTYDKDMDLSVFDNVVFFNYGKTVYMTANSWAYNTARFTSVSCTIHLPAGKSLDLSQYDDYYLNIDTSVKSQVTVMSEQQ